MRVKRHVLVVSVLALAACSAERVGPPPPVPVGSLAPVVERDAGAAIVTARERALPDEYAAALGSAGFMNLGPLLTDDAHFLSPGVAEVHYRDAVVKAHETLFGSFDNRQVKNTRVWRTPDEQTIEWTMTGTQARDWRGTPASQKSVTFRGLTLIWTTDQGFIRDIHVYMDLALIKAQLGSAPKGFPVVPVPAMPAGPAQVFEKTQASAAVEESNVHAARAALDALENNNEAGWVGSFTDDVELDTQESPQPLRGLDIVKSDYRDSHKQIGQLDTTVINAFGVGPFAIVEYTIDGEQLSAISWIPAQRDKVIRLQLVDVEEMRDGKIARVWRYDDPEQILAEPAP